MIIESLLFAGLLASTAHATPSPLKQEPSQQREAAPQQDQEKTEQPKNQDTDSISKLLAQAKAYGQRGDWAKALEIFRQVDASKQMEHAPAEMKASVHGGIGLALFMQQKYEEALPLLKEVHEAFPNDEEPTMLLATDYSAIGQPEKAIELAEPLAVAYPRDFSFQFLLSNLYSQVQNLDKAEEYADKAVRLIPNDPDALNQLGYVYAEEGKNLDQAVILIKRALEIKQTAETKPSDAEIAAIQDSLGWAYFKQGKLQDALQTIQKAAAVLSDNPDVQDHLKAIQQAIDQQK